MKKSKYRTATEMMLEEESKKKRVKFIKMLTSKYMREKLSEPTSKEQHTKFTQSFNVNYFGESELDKKFTLYKHKISILGFTLFKWGKYSMTFQELNVLLNEEFNKKLNRELFGINTYEKKM